MAEKQKSLDALKEKYIAGKDARQELYEDKNPDDEELRLNKAISDAEQAEKQAAICSFGMTSSLWN